MDLVSVWVGGVAIKEVFFPSLPPLFLLLFSTSSQSLSFHSL